MEAMAAACLFSFGSFASMQPDEKANHATMMTALREDAVAKDPSWTGPSCVLTDKCDAEINAAGCDHSS
jgi:hypothetical protein